jgi:hypothetical protein
VTQQRLAQLLDVGRVQEAKPRLGSTPGSVCTAVVVLLQALQHLLPDVRCRVRVGGQVEGQRARQFTRT